MEKLIHDFGVGLFFWQILLFLALLFLLKKVAWKPILNAIEEREEGIRKSLQEAEKARKEMQNLTAHNEKIMKEARLERESLLKEARSIHDKTIEEAKQKAQEEYQRILADAKRDIETEKQAAIGELKKKVAELSVNIAEKLLKEKLSSDQAQISLIEKSLKEEDLN
jgi:F-type H+-transporting ATPase subunit b